MNSSCSRSRVVLHCILLTAMATSAGCDGIVPANAIMHPTEENLPAPGGPLIGADTVLSDGSDPQRTAEWVAARRALLDAEVVTSIGSYDGPDILGIIGDAAVDEEGKVYLQENTTDELLVFSPSGDLLHRTGGTGDGPEEFRGIRRFVRVPDGRLVVAHGGGRPKVLKPDSEGYGYDGLLLEGQTTEAPDIIDMCGIGERIFIHATNLALEDAETHRVIHEVSVEQRRVTASLADGYRSDFAVDRRDRSYGSIACGDGPATLVWSLYYFPIVKAYLPDNTLSWAALVQDFEQGLVYQNDAASPTVNPVSGTMEYLVGVHALRPGFVVLQASRTGRPAADQERTVLRFRTYLIDMETGAGGVVGDTLPRIAWIGDSSFVTVASEPYPKVEVRGLPPEPFRIVEEHEPVAESIGRRQ